jgi:4-aminobutyrate aminotransferase-like enzyme
VIDHNLPAQAKRVGNYFLTQLENLKQQFDFITDVRGRGLLIALEFNQEIGDKLQLGCLDRGLFVNKLKPNAVRFIPPLIITEKEVDRAVAIVRDALREET